MFSEDTESLRNYYKWVLGYHFWFSEYTRRNEVFVSLYNTFKQSEQEIGTDYNYENLNQREAAFKLVDSCRIIEEQFKHKPRKGLLDPTKSEEIIEFSKTDDYPVYSEIISKDVCPIYIERPYYDKPELVKMVIDCTKPLGFIKKFVMNFIYLARASMNNDISDEILNNIPKEYRVGLKVLNELFTTDPNNPIGYDPKHNVSRAIGIWAWDNISCKKKTIRNAYNEFIGKYPDRCSLDDSTFSRYHDRTSECIKVCQVLTIA
jgi:hypothetical protein